MSGPAKDPDKLRILVAEDDEDLLALYDKALPDIVFEKRLVTNGNKAIEVYEKWGPDILLMDIVMPIKTGCSVIKEIRGRIRNGDTTIIISTSMDDMEEVEECSGLSVQGYIIKPFNYKKLALEILEFYKNKEPKRAAKAISRLKSSFMSH